MTVILSSLVQHWPIDRLAPYSNNARTHSSEQVAQIAASIGEFGFTNPILVAQDGGILAGHARLEAARLMQLPHVPVIVLDHLTPIQRQAYILADNKLALNAGWDDELLAQELAALEAGGFELSLLGFSEDELAAFRTDDDKDHDQAPEPPAVPVSQPGDLWLLGPHRVLCGDATDPSSLVRLMDGAKADMVFCDPPYNVRYLGSGSPDRQILNDDLGDQFEDFLSKACVNLLAATDGAIYICMSSSELHTLHRAFTAAGGHWSTFLIWVKNSFTLGRSDYQRQYEPILYGWREGGPHHWCGDRSQGDVWEFDKPVRNDLHPTMKPVELVERAIRNSSRSKESVLDAFGGAGSTLIACEKSGRRGRILEIDPKYVDVIVRRWQEFTGGRAVRERDGACLD